MSVILLTATHHLVCCAAIARATVVETVDGAMTHWNRVRLAKRLVSPVIELNIDAYENRYGILKGIDAHVRDLRMHIPDETKQDEFFDKMVRRSVPLELLNHSLDSYLYQTSYVDGATGPVDVPTHTLAKLSTKVLYTRLKKNRGWPTRWPGSTFWCIEDGDYDFVLAQYKSSIARR